MGRTRWPVAIATALALVVAPGARAQEKQPTANGTGGAASSVDPLATQAAIDVLAGGGNAFDAAVAAAGVLGVVEPYSCGIGGGGFMVIRDGDSGRITTIDSREKAPAAMKPDSFFINGKPPTDAQFPLNRYSGLSVGVPGTPAAWDYLLKHYGTISLSKALSYGVNVATNGFVVDKTFYDQTTGNQTYFDDIPSSAKIYLDPDGTSQGRRHDPQEPGHGAHLPPDRPPGRDQGLLHRPGRGRDRQGRRAGPGDRRQRARVEARPADHGRPRQLPDQGPRAGEAELLRRRRLRHGPAVLRRQHGARGAEHPAGLPAPRRAVRRPRRPALRLPGGVAAGLRRPQRLHRRPVVRQQPDRGPAEQRLRGHARRADRPEGGARAPSPPARRPRARPPAAARRWTRWARRRT